MKIQALTIEERHHIDSGAWFSRLSGPLRDDILDRAVIKRYADGAPLGTRGGPAEQWSGVARGAVRVSNVTLSGKQVVLTYVEPGTWFGDIALFDGLPRTHDANAHGDTTLLVVRKADFKELLATHVELYDALLRLSRHGVPCSEPLFWAHGEAEVHGRFELLATREIEGAVPLKAWIEVASPSVRSISSGSRKSASANRKRRCSWGVPARRMAASKRRCSFASPTRAASAFNLFWGALPRRASFHSSTSGLTTSLS